MNSDSQWKFDTLELSISMFVMFVAGVWIGISVCIANH